MKKKNKEQRIDDLEKINSSLQSALAQATIEVLRAREESAKAKYDSIGLLKQVAEIVG
jgi:hypothetical protein